MKLRGTNIILIIMLLLNVAFIASWWAGRSEMRKWQSHVDRIHKWHDRGAEYLAKQLDLNKSQQVQLEKIFSEHGVIMRKYQAEIGKFQKEIFKCLAKDTPDSTLAFEYADSVGIWRIAMQKEFFRNSFRIREICNAEQKKKYDELMQNMAQRLNRHWYKYSDTTKHDSV